MITFIGDLSHWNAVKTVEQSFQLFPAYYQKNKDTQNIKYKLFENLHTSAGDTTIGPEDEQLGIVELTAELKKCRATLTYISDSSV